MAPPRRPTVFVLIAAVTHALQPPRPKHYARTTLRRHVTVPVPLEYAAELAATALALVAPGKGVLSIDESLPTRTPFGAALSLPSLPPLGGSTRSLPSLGSSRLSLDDDGGDAPLPPPSRRRVLELPRLEERPVAFSWWAFTNPSPAARAEAPAVHR